MPTRHGQFQKRAVIAFAIVEAVIIAAVLRGYREVAAGIRADGAAAGAGGGLKCEMHSHFTPRAHPTPGFA